MTVIRVNNSPSIYTVSGRLFPLLSPAPDDVDLRDIAEALAKINRFTGHTVVPYSVAQHCLFVCDLLPPELQPYGLLHDAHEAYSSDLSTPHKHALVDVMVSLGIAEDTAKRVMRHIPSQIDEAVFRRFGLPWPLSHNDEALIKHADLVAFATECRDLFDDEIPLAPNIPPPSPVRITTTDWLHAADLFLTRAKQVLPHV